MSLESEIYSRDLKGITEAYSKSKSWEDVFSSDYFNSDENTSMEAFIDLVEDVYKTEIKDTKQLEELTGLITLLPKELTLEYILTSSKYSKFSRAISKALEEGAKYKDLIQIKPKDYSLPENWSGCLSSDQYTTILWAISFTYLLNEPGYTVLAPKPRDIAEDLEAPLSVIIDAFLISRKVWKA
jgi:hypothetical protein